MATAGADCKLTELEQQLEMAETKCGSLKCQLDYMKMLYQRGIHSDSCNAETISSKLQFEDTLASEKSDFLFPINKADTKEVTNSNNVRCNAVFNETRAIRHKTRANNEIEPQGQSPNKTPVYYQCLSNLIERSIEQSNSIKNIIEQRFFTGGERTEKLAEGINYLQESVYILPESKSTYLKTSSLHKNDKEEYNASNCAECPYKNESLALTHNMSVVKEYTNQLIPKEPEVISHNPTFTSEAKKHDLILNISTNVETDHILKKPDMLNTDRKEKLSYSPSKTKKTHASTVDDVIISKVKRKKEKLQRIHSKSTVATRDTTITGRKDLKKRKHKGRRSSSQQRTSQTTSQRTWSEVVEIYHNIAANSASVSAISSKPSKLDSHTKQINKEIIAPNYIIDSNVDTSYEHKHSNYGIFEKRKTQQSLIYEQVQNKKTSNVIDHNSHRHPEPGDLTSDATMPKGKHQCQCAISANYCNAMAVHNYEMSTLASRLKKANRSYFSRFNFKNIPFVVGTSLSPSHNLGLNIQQVLSIMKTRQSAIGGITPLLIRKVSKGVKPVSVLMKRINGEYEGTLNCQQFQMVNIPNKNQLLDSNLCDQNYLLPSNYMKQPNFNLLQNQQVYERNTADLTDVHNVQAYDLQAELQWSKCGNGGLKSLGTNSHVNMLEKMTSSKNLKNHSSAALPQEEMKCKGFQDMNPIMQTHNSKGIRDVFMNLHDQFEEMNVKYEKLQTEAGKSTNKILQTELSTLEKELNVKAEEINAVVGLYHEVLALKHQMKLLQNKSSFVCIAAEVPMVPPASQRMTPIPYTYNHSMPMSMQGNNSNKRITMNGVREPSTSIRLAGLLRQIQSFQKQLKLM